MQDFVFVICNGCKALLDIAGNGAISIKYYYYYYYYYYFDIMKAELPLDMLDMFDHIVTVTAAIVNLQPPIVPL